MKKNCLIQQKLREEKVAAAVMNEHGKWKASKRQQKRIIVTTVENNKGIVVKKLTIFKMDIKER